MPKAPPDPIPVFWINLDERPDRRGQMETRLAGLPHIRVPAVPGRSLSEDTLKKFIAPTTKYHLSSNEAACALSHRHIWHTMIDEELHCACVLEDDVVLSSAFPTFINSREWLPDKFDVIKIETMLTPVFMSRRKRWALDRGLRRLRSPHFGTAGYIVSQQGAVKLLELSERPDRALDDLMFESTLHKRDLIDVQQLEPALCAQDFIVSPRPTPSDIATDRQDLRVRVKPKGMAKVWREITRPAKQLARTLRRIPQKRMTIPFV